MFSENETTCFADAEGTTRGANGATPQGTLAAEGIPPERPAQLRLGDVTMCGDQDAADRVRRQVLNLVAAAVAAQGPRALENPRSSTIFHEAGHVVVHAHFGDTVHRCKIWQRKRGADRGQWTGETVTGSEWKSDQTTSPEEDFHRACCQVAGVLAELMFDRSNFRRASSIDEIAVANVLAANVAMKTGRYPHDVMAQVICATSDILKGNADVVHDIANGLERHGVLRAASLSPLLGRVSTSPSRFELEGNGGSRAVAMAA